MSLSSSIDVIKAMLTASRRLGHGRYLPRGLSRGIEFYLDRSPLCVRIHISRQHSFSALSKIMALGNKMCTVYTPAVVMSGSVHTVS